MHTSIPPEQLWQDRLDELEWDFKRIQVLLDSDLKPEHPELGGSFSQLLSELQVGFDDLKNSYGTAVSPATWGELAALDRRCRQVSGLQLELLGGIHLRRGGSGQGQGIDEGFAVQAENWLQAVHTRLGIKSRPLVIPGRRPMLLPGTDLGRDVVHTPFLDRDLWYLPLLARATGLLAAVEDLGGHFAATVPVLLPQAGQIFPRQAPQCLRDNSECQRAYLQSLSADMFATAVVGPMYAMAVFVLELDYSQPEQYVLEDPDPIEGREQSPRLMPAPVERAAAVLMTLEAMAPEASKSSKPYAEVIQRLETWCQEGLQSLSHPDALAAARQRFAPWHSTLLDRVVRKRVAIHLPFTLSTWQRGQAWYTYLSEPGPLPDTPPDCEAEKIADLLTGMWWHRLINPAASAKVLEMARQILDRQPILRYTGPRRPPAQAVVEARLERLRNRSTAMQDLLQGDRFRYRDRVAVTARFHRLLSQQEYWGEQCQKALDGNMPPQEVWTALTRAEGHNRLLQREALEFLGGLLIRYRRLDSEPQPLTHGTTAGPSICALADRLLRGLARRTGIPWTARTVLGREPFLAPETEVIRVRFPDWSLWNLPLMGHEFGHLVAAVTPAFRRYQAEVFREMSTSAGDQRAREATRHLEEFFADVFAVYVLGPAFACSAILLQFSPAEAYTERELHPTHEERAQVILQTLARMDARTAQSAFANIHAQLKRSWKDAVQACQARPQNRNGFDKRLECALEWGGQLYDRLDRFYRLGAAYTAERWAYGQTIAERLRQSQPSLASLRALGDPTTAVEPTLEDVLNGLWYARALLVTSRFEVHRLSAAAYSLGYELLKE
jgi:hypothetical protein